MTRRDGNGDWTRSYAYASVGSRLTYAYGLRPARRRPSGVRWRSARQGRQLGHTGGRARCRCGSVCAPPLPRGGNWRSVQRRASDEHARRAVACHAISKPTDVPHRSRLSRRTRRTPQYEGTRRSLGHRHCLYIIFAGSFLGRGASEI